MAQTHPTCGQMIQQLNPPLQMAYRVVIGPLLEGVRTRLLPID